MVRHSLKNERWLILAQAGLYGLNNADAIISMAGTALTMA